MLKRTFLIFAGILVVHSYSLWAGDTASFVDLGFSPDGKVYMFAQYGVQSSTLKPWADVFVVDVARNDFVSGGRLSYTHGSPIAPGQNGSGALYRLLAQNAGLAERYGISFPNQGQPLYISLDEDFSAEGESIEFRDFDARKAYRAYLVSSVEGNAQNVRSSFYIALESFSDEGRQGAYTVGTPNLKRPLITSYHIKKVIVNPRGDSLIFVIEMRRQVEEGYEIRYMVEALRL